MFAENWATQISAQILLMAASALFAAGQQPAAAPTPSTDVIVERMMTTRTRQMRQLQAFEVLRDYRVDYHGVGGEHHAEAQVATSYLSPDKKEFRIVSKSGSKFLLDHIVNKLLESEREDQKAETESELSPRNYDFRLLGMEHANNNDSYVMEITPRRKAKYLCRGKIWINAGDYGITRLEGEPAKNPSFWISHTEMANTYRKIGDFWLPVHKDATTEVRLGGKAVLAIDYSGYRVIPGPKSLEASTWTIFGIPRAQAAEHQH